MRHYSLSVFVLAVWGTVRASAGVLTSDFTLNPDDPTFDRQDLVVSNCTLTVNGAHRFASLRLVGGGVVTHAPSSATETGSLDLTVDGLLSIDGTSRIDASARGYGQGRTVGNTTDGGATGESGGSYGGLGIPWDGSANGTYGDYRDPRYPGSGGGSSYSSGAGGGLIRVVAGSVRLDGTILADGGSTIGRNGGGGSGGGIHLTVGALSGGGRVQANGGESSYHGGGGGGRVAIYYASMEGFDGTSQVTAHGGVGRGAGSVGTVYLKPAGGLGQLVLASHGAATGLWTPLGEAADTTFTVDRLLLAGTNVVAATAEGAPIRADSVSVLEGAVLTHPVTTSSRVYTLAMTITNDLRVDASARIDVSARGYPQGYSLGNSRTNGATGESGGSYGGLGVSWDGGANVTYGDFRDPQEPGSGGGSSYSSGAGGGLIRIQAASARLDGAVLAHGASVIGANGGGGSGGGIWLRTETLSGSGVIAASGGDSSYHGGGGGGRVAVYYTAASGFDLAAKVQTHGGTGRGAGSLGTVYLRPSAGPEELRLSSHGAPAGLWTPLGSPADKTFTVDRLVASGTNVVVATVNGAPLAVQSLTLSDGAVLTHPVTTAGETYALRVTVRDDLRIDASSKIDVSGRGYPQGRTLGNTRDGGASGESGGSYGGLGYPWDGGPNATYGDYRDPQDPGAGGGSGYSSGAGGGLVRITAGNLQVDGAILANGVSAIGYNGGGGSGGGVYLWATKLSGRGLVSANGGGSSYQGSGGGGRIAIYYTTLDGFDPATQATVHGGSPGPGPGAVGTLYVKPAQTAGELRLENHGTTVGMWTPLGGAGDTTFQAENLVLAGAGLIVATANGAPIEAQSVTLLNGAVLTHPATSAAQTHGLRMTLSGALRVDATSKIDVTGRGYPQGRTTGNTREGGATGESGGSYGGLGADYDGTANAVYGDYRDPLEPGAGGGSGYSSGAGGGLIRIQAASAQVDGVILANGVSALGVNGGGAAGGGIWLHVGELSGQGRIGADGGQSSYQGGGSGGRVALYYRVCNGFDLEKAVTAHAGQGAGGTGAVGTVYQKADDLPGYLLISSHGTPAGRWTPLGLAGDREYPVDTLVISGTNVVVAPEHQMRVVAQAVSVSSGAVLTHRTTTDSQVYSLDLTVVSNVVVDAASRIDVSRRGYPQGRTVGNTRVNGATGESGGSYGGLGRAYDGQPNPVYGDAHNPQEPGSGGGSGYSSAPGGGLVRITAGGLWVDGAIRADGGSAIGVNGGGGSGGGILLNTGSLVGEGTIGADGGSASYQGGAGGGRVAIYTWNDFQFANTNITALAGSGPQGSAQAGTVVVHPGAFFAWSTSETLFHDVGALGWYAYGADPAQSSVDVYAFRAGEAYPVVTGASSQASAAWDTIQLTDGVYELFAVWQNASGEPLATLSRTVLVNNSVLWHAGSLATNEVWRAGRTHLVESDVVIPAGVTLTIDAGVVVKFAPGTRILVQAGGAIEVSPSATAPIVFTSLADDTSGGDTNLDGDDSRPQPGDWGGVLLSGDGRFDGASRVEFRYLVQTHTGSVAQDEVWSGEATHWVTGEVLVPGGATLTLRPGAVLKFSNGAGLTVQSGGVLNALGTVAQPIVWTSAADDTVGGDSNRDGEDTTAAPGDWRSLRLEGSAAATLVHNQLRFGGNSTVNQWGAGGMIEVTGGKLTVDSCVVTASLKDGIVAAGSAEIVNSTITDTGRGVTAWGDVTVRNCTVDNNGQGVVEHGGILVVRNCLITRNQEVGVLHDWGTERVTISYSDVWNPDAENYRGTPDATGKNGNLSADPGYRDGEGGDYRLTYQSPAIDAGDAAWAPTTDATGAPRYDDPRTPNTGVPWATTGAVPDLGAFEFVENAVADVDLQGRAVVGPRAVTAGRTAIVQWEVVNSGSGLVRGPWHDRLYLRALGDAPALLPAGEVLVGQGVVLGPGQSYTASASVRVPGGVEGAYFWQVGVNSRGDVFEGILWTNNTALASVSTALSVPALTVDGSAVTNRFATAAESCWYKFVAPENADYLVSLDLAGAGATELYVGEGYMPTAQRFDYRQARWNVPDSSVVVPATAQRVYYILARAASLASSPSQFTLRVRRPNFEVASVSPTSAGNVGCVTFEISGSQFEATDTVEAQMGTGAVVQAIAKQFINSAFLRATFDLHGAAPGAWDLRVRRGAATVSLNRAITVEAGGGASAWASAVGRGTVRTGRTYEYEVVYGNKGNVDADLVVVVSGIPNDAQIQLGPEFVATPLPAKLTNQLPLYFQSDSGLILTRLMATAMRPGEGGSASFTLSVPSTAAFEIRTWTFAANTPPDAYTAALAFRTEQEATLTAVRAAARAAAKAGGCPCNDELELLALDRIVQCAQVNSWNNNFMNRVFGQGQNCVETADDMIKNQLPNWIKTHNQDNVFCGWTAQRITHVSALQDVTDYLSSWHTTVLLTSPCGRHWALDDYMTGAVLIDAYEDEEGFFRVDASTGFLLTKGFAGVHGMAYDNLWESTSKALPLDAGASGTIPTVGGGGGGFCSTPTKQDAKSVKPQQSADPNVKIGPTGGGEWGAIAPGQPLYYQIYFENKAAATAPAQEVRISDSLSANLDLSSFELGRIGFNGVTIDVPAGLRSFTTNVYVSTDPNPVRVTASLDPNTGVATWYMMSMDPATGLLVEDPIAGFLPPNNAAQQGVGYVSYVIRHKEGLASGELIVNQANIVFDVNAPILTPAVTNLLDALPPTSRVNALPAQSGTEFSVSWTGTDDTRGAGIASYDVYVSTDTGPFVPWVVGATNTTAAFTGQSGSSYRFFSLARDYAGNLQSAPIEPYASTTVSASPAATTVLRAGPEMRIARMGHYIVTLPDGRVVVLGGHGQDFVSLASIEIWRPGDAAFAAVTTPFTFDSGALARLADGRYLMAGGAANLGVAPGYNTAQIFDPASGTAVSAGATMNRPRTQCRGARLSDGRVLIVGGWYDTASATYGELYDPTTRKFSATGALRTPRALPAVLPTADGKAVIAGGLGVYGTPSSFSQVELYDPAANTFSVLSETLFPGETGWALGVSLERVIDDQRLADGRYVLQATRATNGVTEVVLALFDPASRQFTKLPLSPAFTEAASAWPPVVSAGDNAVYFLSGSNSNNAANLTFRVQRVDLASGRRTSSDALSVSDYYPGSHAAALLADGRLLVSGGTTRVDSRYNFAPVSRTFLLEGLPGSGTTVAPSLSWTRTGRTLTLSWPAAGLGYVLDSADQLNAQTAWTAVDATVSVVNQQNTVTVNLDGTNRFYRIRRP